MVKKALSSGARAVFAAALVVSILVMGLLSGCANGAQAGLEDKAVPEAVAPLEPVAGVEPMQSYGGEEAAGEDE